MSIKHPVHRDLMAIPVALWIASLFCDLLYLGGAEAAIWSPLALYSMVGGFVVALAAAAPRLSKMRLAHVPVELIVIGFYAVNLWTRLGDSPSTAFAIALSMIGVSILAASGWLVGARVQVQGAK